MTVLAVLTVLAALESTLPSFCLSYEIQHNEATAAVLAVLVVVTVAVVTATPPLNSTPLLRHPDSGFWKTMPSVPVSGSGSVPGPSCFLDLSPAMFEDFSEFLGMFSTSPFCPFPPSLHGLKELQGTPNSPERVQKIAELVQNSFWSG